VKGVILFADILGIWSTQTSKWASPWRD